MYGSCCPERGYKSGKGGVTVTLIGLIGEGARWSLVIVFVLAIAEKVATLRSGSAQWHPLMLVTLRRQKYATPLMIASLFVDVLAVALLVSRSAEGALVSGGILLVYTAAAWPVHESSSDSTCRCFYGLFNSSTRKGLILRNSLLFALAVVTWLEPVRSVTWSGMLGAILLLAAIAVASRFTDKSFGPKSPGAALRKAKNLR